MEPCVEIEEEVASEEANHKDLMLEQAIEFLRCLKMLEDLIQVVQPTVHQHRSQLVTVCLYPPPKYKGGKLTTLHGKC